MNYGGIFKYEQKKDKLEELKRITQDTNLWENPKKAQEVSREQKILENIISEIDNIKYSIDNCKLLLDLAIEESDQDTINSIDDDLQKVENDINKLEFNRMFNKPYDINNCFIDIVAGAGGVEAEDWAGMLLRMYIRYAQLKKLKVEIIEEDASDIAGVNRATIKISGDYAYGLLRTEAGIHRLVRCSPFDSSNKRHTSFCSIFVYPEVDNSINIEINPADLRIDTYRASGAGGQHINKTDSAVRITHNPSGIVVQCQSDRSQHRNKEEAMNMLKAKLFDLEIRKQNKEKQDLEDSKLEVGWGHQIRSYVFDQSRIKDLRTGYEVNNIKSVMDGNIDCFIEESLKKGI